MWQSFAYMASCNKWMALNSQNRTDILDGKSYLKVQVQQIVASCVGRPAVAFLLESLASMEAACPGGLMHSPGF